MKKTLAILFICSLFSIASVGNSQNSESLSSSYDGIWEGYTDTPEGRYDIKMEIKNGIMSGYFEETKIKGQIESDNNLSISPFSVMGAQVALETNFMSPDRIGGTLVSGPARPKWFVKKAGTDKPEITTSNFQINEKEPWTGKWKVESTSQGSGIWAMKQKGGIVKSTADSAYEFRGRVRENQLKGFLEGGSDLSFTMEMPPDAMSFKGALEIWGRSYQLNGNRIE